MKGISIVICTYNGKQTIGKAIDNIVKQKNYTFPIELIIVDNASTDDTYDYVVNKVEKLKFPLQYSVFKQPLCGKYNAQLIAFANAKFEYILICDDDNFLNDDYCIKAYNILESDKKIGAVGGKGVAVFENNEPEWFKKFQNVFACGDQYSKTGIIEDNNVNLWGAAMVFRKEIWNKIITLKFNFFLNARRTKHDSSGGDDTELCELAKYMGYSLYYSNELVFKHYIPASRTTFSFLKRRYKGFGKSRIYARAYRYCDINTELPNQHLKRPYWKDILAYRKKELLKYYPKILFTKEKPENYQYLLYFISLKAEIAEIKILKEKYIDVYRQLFDLKEKLKNIN